mmetsp:Transcript_42115/g.70269  ORF Transcript_42115/g.70269 Transcript_42115/m.70269 type:complete len:218 (+) Transcript_42115:710-1363(+)
MRYCADRRWHRGSAVPRVPAPVSMTIAVTVAVTIATITVTVAVTVAVIITTIATIAVTIAVTVAFVPPRGAAAVPSFVPPAGGRLILMGTLRALFRFALLPLEFPWIVCCVLERIASPEQLALHFFRAILCVLEVQPGHGARTAALHRALVARLRAGLLCLWHHPLDDVEQRGDELQRHLRTRLFELLLEGGWLVMAPREIDDELGESLVSDAQVII